MNIISWDEFRRQQQGSYQLTITPNDLRLGDFVSRVEALDETTTFPPQGMRIDSFKDKRWFNDNCRRVVIDLERCLNRRSDDSEANLTSIGALPPLPNELDALRARKLSARGMIEAWQIYRRVSLVAQAQILSFHRHGHIDVADANDAVNELVEAVPDHLPELIWLARIKETSRYPFQHGLNSALFASGFAFAAGWPKKIRAAVTLSALLHDLGMMRVSLQVIRKNGPLTAAEREHVQLHTRLGHELLAQNDGIPEAVARVALSHHEQPDGKGYPDGLTLKGIPAMARLIAIISAYDAMMSNRFHRQAISHQKAMGEMWRMRGRQFDEVLVDGFSRFLGWAPPGTLMRLGDGRLAVALHTRPEQNRPVVRLLHKRGGEVEFGYELDLSEAASLASSEGRRETLLSDGASGIKHRDLTRLLPKAMVAGLKGGADESQPAQARRERRSRPRIDAPKGTRILVVDDALTIRETLRNMLSQSGYEILLAETGEKGLALAEIEQPDLIFLDIVLPDLSGFRALRRLRAKKSTQELPVIMISGNSGAIEKFFLQRVGADDFIGKPFGRFEVFSAIERLIRSGALARRKAV